MTTKQARPPQKTPKTNQPLKYRKSNTLFLQAVKSQPFHKNINSASLTWLQQQTPQITNYADLLLETIFPPSFFPTTVVSFRASWLKWQCFEGRMWFWVFPTLLEQPGELFVATQSSAGTAQSCCLWREWIMEHSSLFCVKHFKRSLGQSRVGFSCPWKEKVSLVFRCMSSN